METPLPSNKLDKPFDAIVLGGGPAGLAAAVYLGRYLRPTLILDEKKPRTRWHRPISHNVLGFPAGIHRNQLLDWGRTHVAKYECVNLRRTTVTTIRQRGELFELGDSAGETYLGRGLILGPGLEYELPEDIPGIYDYAGITLFHCPECDGYKCLGKKVVVVGNNRGTAEMALNVSIWADQVTLCTHGGKAELDEECLRKLAAANIPVNEGRIVRIQGSADDGEVESFELTGGEVLPAFAAFINVGCSSPTDLLTQLPLELLKDKWVKVDHRMRTNIPRCYAVGDVIANGQTQLSVAMGTGATAAIWLHKELLPEGLCLSDREW